MVHATTDRLTDKIKLEQLVDIINFPRNYSAELKDDGTEKLMIIHFIFTLQDDGQELRSFLFVRKNKIIVHFINIFFTNFSFKVR